MRRTIRLVVLLLLATLGTNRISAQSEDRIKIDSLFKELSRQKDDTNKVSVLNGLGMIYYLVNPDSGLAYGNQSLKLAGQLGWKKGVAVANRVLGVNYGTLGEYATGLKHCFAGLKLSEDISDTAAIIRVLSSIIVIYLDQGEYSKALELSLRALKLAEAVGDKPQIALASCNVSVIYQRISDFPKALEYAFRSLKADEELGDQIEIGRVMLVIGNVYGIQGDKEKSLEYYLKSLKAFEKAGTKKGIASVTTNIGTIYSYQGKNEAALEYYFKAMRILEELGDAHSIAQNAICIGATYASMGDYANALAYTSAALKKAQELGAQANVCYALVTIGGVYLSLANDSVNRPSRLIPELPAGLYAAKDIPASKSGRLRLAISFLERAHDSAKVLGLMDVWGESSQKLADAYSMAGRHDKALDAYRDYVNIKDSVFSQESRQKTLQQQMQYDYGKREDSLKLVNAGKEKVAALRYQRQQLYTGLGIGGVLLLGVFLFFMARNNKLLAKEKNRSEGLLLNILPAEVAEELKDKGNAQAMHYDNVTVLFTDFVNFTQAAEQMSPQGLIDELHACFKMFDEITAKCNIEKIKTIGDAYLAVCGLPTADPKHAENIVSAAIEINTFMADRLAKMGSERTFQVRIGIHSGSVVAGIVGVKKFAYDIWGDTVNTAARMEQHGEAGKINISQTTYELVKDKFTCEYRGEVEAKGKGVMKMYFVS